MNAEEHIKKGRLLLDLGNAELAEKEFRSALALEPGNASAHVSLSLCLAHLGRCRHDASLRDEDLATENRFGRVGGRLRGLWSPGKPEAGYFKEALAEAQEAVRLAPDDAWAHYAVAVALDDVSSGREAAAAEKALDEAIRLDPHVPAFYSLRAHFLSAEEQWAGALRAAERGLEVDPTHVGCLQNRIWVLMHMGRRRSAEEALVAALEQHPDAAEFHFLQGQVALARGEGTDFAPRAAQKATSHFREALRINPLLRQAKLGLRVAQNVAHSYWSRIAPERRKIPVFFILILMAMLLRLHLSSSRQEAHDATPWVTAKSLAKEARKAQEASEASQSLTCRAEPGYELYAAELQPRVDEIIRDQSLSDREAILRACPLTVSVDAADPWHGAGIIGTIFESTAELKALGIIADDGALAGDVALLFVRSPSLTDQLGITREGLKRQQVGALATACAQIVHTARGRALNSLTGTVHMGLGYRGTVAEQSGLSRTSTDEMVMFRARVLLGQFGAFVDAVVTAKKQGLDMVETVKDCWAILEDNYSAVDADSDLRLRLHQPSRPSPPAG